MSMDHQPQLAIMVARQDGSLTLAGDLIASDAEKLERWFRESATQDTPCRLELGELDITDGVAATYMINIVRLIMNRCEKVTLSGSPQLLAHNLYRAGLLFEGCTIALEGMREDEPYG